MTAMMMMMMCLPPKVCKLLPSLLRQLAPFSVHSPAAAVADDGDKDDDAVLAVW